MKYILVTGAYGGMGKSTVKALRDRGFCVIALDRKIGEPEENIIPIEADISDVASIRAAAEQVRTVTNRLFAIVHFAGIYMLDSFVEIEDERLLRAFSVNTLGAMEVNKIFLPLLENGSRIVITTSELAPLDPLPFTGIYAVTKSALDKYAYSLRMELQLLGISVSVLRAGAVDTGMLGASTDELDKFCKETRLYSCNAERFKQIVERVEARKIPPEKISAKVMKILGAKRPKFAYAINRNPLLLLLSSMPKGFQVRIIGKILK